MIGWVLNGGSAVLTIAALAAGTYAAILCWRASKVPIDPGWGPGGLSRPVIPELEQMGWTAAMLQAAQTTGKLNEKAARWTIAAVLLSALASLLSLAPTLLASLNH